MSILITPSPSNFSASAKKKKTVDMYITPSLPLPLLQVQLVTNVFRKTSTGWRLTRHHASDRDVATVKSAGGKQTLKAARELPGGGSSLLHNFVDKTGGVTELSARLFRVVNGEMR